MPRWYGKRQHLAEVPLKGNGQIIVRTTDTKEVIYRNSFSTLFQEWLATDEAKHTQKSFENVFLVPFPKQPVDVTVELYDYHDRVSATTSHRVDPKDILIRKTDSIATMPYITLQQAADTSRCIHVAYVAEGYQADEMPRFIEDCKVAMESLFKHEPFKHLKDRFNIVAVQSPSVRHPLRAYHSAGKYRSLRRWRHLQLLQPYLRQWSQFPPCGGPRIRPFLRRLG